MNAARLAELTNASDARFAKFMAQYEANWNRRPATEELDLLPETIQLLMEELNAPAQEIPIPQ